MSAIMTACIVLVVVNLVLLTALLVVYGGMLREVRTGFTMGLLAFAGVLWIQNAVQLYFFATMMEYFVAGLEPLVLAQDALATVASAFLLGVTLWPVGIGGPQKNDAVP